MPKANCAKHRSSFFVLCATQLDNSSMLSHCHAQVPYIHTFISGGQSCSDSSEDKCSKPNRVCIQVFQGRMECSIMVLLHLTIEANAIHCPPLLQVPDYERRMTRSNEPVRIVCQAEIDLLPGVLSAREKACSFRIFASVLVPCNPLLVHTSDLMRVRNTSYSCSYLISKSNSQLLSKEESTPA